MLHTKTIHAELIGNTSYRTKFHTIIGITKKVIKCSRGLCTSRFIYHLFKNTRSTRDSCFKSKLVTPTLTAPALAS
jgi:hypothetical protein